MEFLSQFLPIVIYFLLIIFILVGIVLGIKIIITMDRVLKIVEDVENKIERVTPIFNAFATVSDKLTAIVTTVFETIQNVIFKLFLKNKKEETESEIDGKER